MKSLSTLILVFFAASAHAATEECANVDANQIVTSTSVATVRDAKGQASLEDLVASTKLVEKALAFEGNLGYDFVKNAEDPNEYRFVEKWESMEALSKWMAGFPSTLFSGQVMKGVLLGEEFHDVQKYITPAPASCRPHYTGTITYSVEADCSVVMKDLSRWDNANYLYGVPKAELKPAPDGSDDLYRVLTWENWGFSAGSIRHYINEDEFTLIYEITEYPSNPRFSGYTGDFTMTQKSDGCEVVYKFTNPKGGEHDTDEEIYEAFYRDDVTHQQNLYSKK
jgi:heme-degrading monooxygenase HmoA